MLGHRRIIYNGTEFVLDTAKYSGSDWGNWDDQDKTWDDIWGDFEKEIDSKKKKCNHVWKATQLVFTTVYDCEKCGAKKEEE